MSVGLIPIVIVPLAFLFVLLIILIVKTPRAGAWVVGSLILLGSILLWRFATAGGFRNDEEVIIPLVVVPATFLFVLLIILLTKAPKAGAGLIVALVIMGLFGLYFVGHRSSRPYAVVQHAMPQPPVLPEPLPAQPIPPPPGAPAPIWSAGVDRELNADVYPSKAAAVQALGSRIDKSVRELVGDTNSPPQITLFQEEFDRALVVELKNAIQQVLSQASCAIESELRNLKPQEIGITLRLPAVDVQSAPWAKSSETKALSGRIELNVSTTGGHAAASRRFVEKPWMENFAAFASTRPQQHFIIARSVGTCTSESEANQQALDDARARLTEAIGNRGGRKLGPSAPEITTTDVLQGGFIVDRFAQSFEGSVGKIWRQALLIDVSGSKLAQLAGQKAREFREVKMTWARMGLSAVGVVLLIGVIYFFLNMATRGYYEWSLRIAGVILAIVAVLSVLMVVR
jgi:hypothetical protein